MVLENADEKTYEFIWFPTSFLPTVCPFSVPEVRKELIILYFAPSKSRPLPLLYPSSPNSDHCSCTMTAADANSMESHGLSEPKRLSPVGRCTFFDLLLIKLFKNRFDCLKCFPNLKIVILGRSMALAWSLSRDNICRSVFLLRRFKKSLNCSLEAIPTAEA